MKCENRIKNYGGKNMEIRRIISLVAAFATGALMSINLAPEACAQAQINTKKMKIGDFPEKIMKVVLTGNPMIDNVLQDEISSEWRISPYEFCTLDDFEANKTNPDFYFMILSKSQFKKESEPGIEFLTVVKGGKDAEKGIDEMLEACTFPVRAAQMPSGREFDFLPYIIGAMQGYIQKSMTDDRVGYAGLGKYALGLSGTAGKKVVFASGDVSPKMPETVREKALAAGIEIVDDDEADELLGTGDTNCVISYTVAPSNPEFGSYCYKMLFGAGDHKLYYFKKQSVGRNGDCGFIASEFNKLAAIRR